VGITGLAVAASLVPSSFAQAAPAPTAALTTSPTSGTPGTPVTGTITVTNCPTATVSVTGGYVNVNGDDATTTPVTAATTADPNVFTAELAVPTDAARSDLSDSPVTFTATATCSTSTPPPTNPTLRTARAAAANQAVGTATVVVNAVAPPTVTVSPKRVKLGKAFTFTISGCTGGLADLFMLDGAGHDTSIPNANVVTTSATAYHGSFKVPTSAKVGSGGLVVDCAQAANAGAGLVLFTTAANAGSGSGAPVAVPVPRVPHFTG
jgi:hypothetical protein